MKTKKEKKETKRSKVKFPGLVKAVNSRPRQEHIDFDYLDKLTDAEKQWLSNFNEEWLSGNFNHPGKIFHKSKKSKRDCYNRNNARNRDLYSIGRTNGWQTLKDEADPDPVNPMGHEDTIVNLLDQKDELQEQSKEANLLKKEDGSTNGTDNN